MFIHIDAWLDIEKVLLPMSPENVQYFENFKDGGFRKGNGVIMKNLEFCGDDLLLGAGLGTILKIEGDLKIFQMKA